jgi:hypothetical protein
LLRPRSNCTASPQSMGPTSECPTRPAIGGAQKAARSRGNKNSAAPWSGRGQLSSVGMVEGGAAHVVLVGLVAPGDTTRAGTAATTTATARRHRGPGRFKSAIPVGAALASSASNHRRFNLPTISGRALRQTRRSLRRSNNRR